MLTMATTMPTSEDAPWMSGVLVERKGLALYVDGLDWGADIAADWPEATQTTALEIAQHMFPRWREEPQRVAGFMRGFAIAQATGFTE